MKRILCFGDSNTWGHDPLAAGPCTRYAEDRRWTGILQKTMGNSAKIIEEGLCGRTIMFDDPLGDGHNGRKYLDVCILSQQPLDLIILMLGTNDIRHIFPPSSKEIAIGMANMVRQARNPLLYGEQPVPDVLVVVPAPILDSIDQSEFYGQYTEISVQKSRELGRYYAEALKGMPGVWLLDPADRVEVSKVDAVHLSADGHAVLASLIKEKIDQIWKERKENHE